MVGVTNKTSAPTRLQEHRQMGQRHIPIFFYLIPSALVAYFSFLTANFQLDDALIYLRYIRNFHEGNGLVYNVGEQFNGLTSPLFSYIILLATYYLDYQVANVLVSAVFMIGAAIFGGLLFSKGKWEFLTTSSLIASCSYFYLTYGMETSLYLCLIGLSLLLTRRNSDWMFVALALLVSTRSEGVFLAIPVTVYYLAKNRQLPRLGHILLSTLILATPWIINQWYYGSPLPDSANAKIQHGRSGLWGEHLAFLHIGYMREWFFNGSLFSIVALLPLSLGGFLMSLKEANTRIILAFLVFLTVFYVGLNITGYHWYFAPYFYFLIMFCGVGLAELTHRRFDGAAAMLRAESYHHMRRLVA
jgi:hypothetical protein